jgi:hypothetical protein
LFYANIQKERVNKKYISAAAGEQKGEEEKNADVMHFFFSFFFFYYALFVTVESAYMDKQRHEYHVTDKIHHAHTKESARSRMRVG